MELTAEQEQRMDQQFAFLREIDAEKQIQRQTYLTDQKRKENDAEHAWHLAMMVLLLTEDANSDLDVLKTISIVLIHDLVEIDAGDTYAYDEAGKSTKRQREQACADRLFQLLPADQGTKMRSLWEEFEQAETPEAKFAHTMDNLQPLLLNVTTNGKSWKEHGVHLSQVEERNAKTHEGSEILWAYAKKHFLDPSVEKGLLEE